MVEFDEGGEGGVPPTAGTWSGTHVPGTPSTSETTTGPLFADPITALRNAIASLPGASASIFAHPSLLLTLPDSAITRTIARAMTMLTPANTGRYVSVICTHVPQRNPETIEPREAAMEIRA